MPAKINLINQTFHNLLVLEETNERKNKSVVWKCKCLLCNSEYLVPGSYLSVTKSCGCLKSAGELEIIRILNENNINYIYQYYIKELNNQSIDFAILDNENNIFCFIEFDGEQHYEKNIKNSGWNDYRHYLKVQEHDQQKDEYAKNQNIPLIRIPYWERGKLTLDSIFNKSLLDLTKLWKENNNYDEQCES